ncbi:MAG: RNA polymerase sigma factor [Xanthobacteraceae bacterium]|jgi:RNA polymerase sigma-70 factor (ECF subfamily)
MTQWTVQRAAGTVADERNLVERAKSGDQSAFRAIMEQNNQRLYRVARAVMKDDTEAEDVVQETYLRAFFNLSKFRGESSLTTWLTRIALNEALGRKRKQRAMVTLETVETAQQTSAQIIQFPAMNTETDPERSAAQNEIQRLLERAMDALPEPFRVVFVMRDVEEMSIEETAFHLGIRPQTVKTRLHRARRLLRQSLDGELASTLKETYPFAGARCARITEAVLSRLRKDKHSQ